MTQKFSFNLVVEPWIPCVHLDGTPVELSLRDTFTQAHRLRTIGGESPPVTASLFRFLLAILHRVFGPKNEDYWEKLWGAETWDMAVLNTYLDQWQHRFDLFDPEHPFYQADDPRVKPKSTISLNHDRASGNNPTLFDHHTEDGGETLTPAQAARTLLVGQAFGLAGLSGITQKFTDGPCASGIIFLVEGDTLKQTLLLNMIKYPPDNDLFYVHTEDDAPAWEMDDPFSPDRSYPLGYLDYLSWQNRRVFLYPEQTENRVIVRTMKMGPALRYESTLLDPMKNYHRYDEKLGFLSLSYREDRVFWQDFASLFAFDENLLGKARPPATFRWLRSLVEDGILKQHKIYRTLALGMSKKQAKVYFFRQERLRMPLDYLTNEPLVSALYAALKKTGAVAFDLVQAARLIGMCQQLSKVDEKGWQKQWADLNQNVKSAITDWITHTGMEQNYWANLDIPFQSFIVDLAQDEEKALADWHAQLRKSALAAFQQAADSVGNDARSFKAVVKGENYLHYRLNELLPEHEKEITP